MSQQPPSQGGWTPAARPETGQEADQPGLESPQDRAASAPDGAGHPPAGDAGVDPTGQPAARRSGGGSSNDVGLSLIKAFGGWSGLVDASLPSLAFVITYTLSGRDLQLALILALFAGVILTVLRLIRKDPLQNIIGGFLVLGFSAWLAHRTGRPEDFYLSSLVIAAVYAVGYTIANLLRWPLIGVVVGLGAGWGLTWRKDPVLVRAFVRAGWLWVALFVLRIAIQGPLYLAGQVEALGFVKVAMSWPLFIVLMWLSYVVIKASVPADKWPEIKRAADAAAAKRPK